VNLDVQTLVLLELVELVTESLDIFILACGGVDMIRFSVVLDLNNERQPYRCT
jgi:hypothetical protein